MIRYAIRKYRAPRDNAANSSNPPSHSATLTNETTPKRSTWEVWSPRLKLTIAILFPCLLETLDYTVVATAQTNIASNFNRLDLQSYIGTAYVLGSTVFLPIFASLADVYGRYIAMQLSVIIFIIGSAFSTGANSMTLLLIGRGIAGVGAAGLLTLVRIILSDSANIDDNNAQGLIMMVVYSLGFSVGPILGAGLLKANWRWVFGINLPVCAASMILMAILLPKITKGRQPPARLQRLPSDVAADLQSRYNTTSALHRLDLVGAAFFIVFGILVLLGLNWGSTDAWNSPKVIACLVIGGLLIIPFVIWEYIVDHSTDHLVLAAISDIETPGEKQQVPKQGTRARLARLTPKFAYVMDPMIPMNMFRSYDIVATDWATMASGMVMLTAFYFIAIFYVIVNGANAVDAGVQLLYFAPGLGAGALVSLVFLKIVRQPKWPSILGATVTPIGVGLLAQALYINHKKFIMASLIVSGAGVGMGFGPLTFQARFSQPEDRVSIVVATNLFARTLGGVIGLAQLSAVMYSRVRRYITNQVYAGNLTIADAARISASLGSVGSESSQGGIFDLPDNLKNITTDAFKDGVRWAFLSLLPWLFIAWILCLGLRPIDKDRLEGRPKQVKEAPKEQEPVQTQMAT